MKLFQHIKQVYEVKYKPITNVQQEPWYQYLEELPLHKKYLKCPLLDQSKGKENVILEIVKPDMEPCPAVPNHLEIWINTDWKDPNQQIVFKESILKNEDGMEKKVTFQEFFKDAAAQQELYDWVNTRTQWIESRKNLKQQKRYKQLELVFRKFWNQYQALKKESLEIMLGQGILVREQIEYPILLKKIRLDFDAENGTIFVMDTDAPSELNVALLKQLENVDEKAINAVKVDLENSHPFAENTRKLLENLTYNLNVFAVYRDSSEKIDSETVIYNKPVLLVRKRVNNILQSFDTIMDEIKQTGKISPPLQDIIEKNISIPKKEEEPKQEEPKQEELSEEERIAQEKEREKQEFIQKISAIRGEDKDILLAKEANKEQIQIGHNIETSDVVLVQSPPGTAKAHMIANLMGHFLAEGNRVLVTSHTQKALSTLKEKIDPELQHLCISLLESDKDDIERSIDGIIKYLSSHKPDKVFDDAIVSERQRKEIISSLQTVRNTLYDIQHKEYEMISFSGEQYTPSEVADFVCENREEMSYIPGEVTIGEPLPVSLKALEFLYQLNNSMTREQELELLYGLPNPTDFMSPETFAQNTTEKNSFMVKLITLQGKIKEHVTIDVTKNTATIQDTPLYSNLNMEKIEEIKEIFRQYPEEKKFLDWELSAISSTKQREKQKGFRKEEQTNQWQELVDTLQDAHEYHMHDNEEKQILRKRVDFDPEYISNKNLELLYKLKDQIQQRGKKMGKLFSLLHKDIMHLYNTLEINGKQISSVADCEDLIVTMSMELKRKEIERLWVELIEKQDGIPFYRLGEAPEQEGIKVIDQIEERLNWHKTVYEPIQKIALECGLSPLCFETPEEVTSLIEEAEHDINLIYKLLPDYISAVELMEINLPNVNTVLQEAIQALEESKSQEFKTSNICNNMLIAMQEQDVERYEKSYKELVAAYQKNHNYGKRSRILDKIEAVAPKWAEAIRNRQGIHGKTDCPENIKGAWNWKQLSMIVNDIIKLPFNEMQKQLKDLSTTLQKTTAKLVESKTWNRIFEEMKKNSSQKQLLQDWKTAVVEKGKMSPEAQQLMLQCQHIVPAWIMSINQVLEQFHPTENKFDIAIIDEANQCNLSSLAILHMAKKVILLGDEKQFGPTIIPTEPNIKNLIGIVNAQLYDAKHSLYDIAKARFETIMLKEHFRSLPHIIGYNNRIFYDNQLQPLRSDKNVVVKPATISYRVKGVKDSKNRNVAEAKNIVALMLACIEQPEYQNMTFGVISLGGPEQARLIQKLSFDKIGAQEYENRQILCGNASYFQNEERDIIFISLVDNEGELAYSKKEIHQNYNVAVSRAKNQLWVVHSLDVRRDLKPDDIRKDFIEYVTNPTTFDQTKPSSYFEKAVAKALIKRGYHIIPKWRAGNYYIDMVVVYQDNKVAITCDGKKYENSDDNLLQDMEKQATLERVGWKFIRIRGSEYYNDPEQMINRVIADLKELGIEPEPSHRPDFTDLQRKVRVRASQIMNEWKKETEEQ